MKLRKRIVMATLSSSLALGGLVASTVPVAAASATIVSSAPCTPTGSYRSVSHGSEPGENAYYSKCTSGGYTYLVPNCRAEDGTSDWIDFPYPGPGVYLDECYIFVWTTGGSYVTRFGFANFNINMTPNYTYSAYYHPSGYLKLSGYYVSTEVCAHSRYWFTDVGYINENIGCAQSGYGAP
jgi:hypothetical protein